MALIKCSECGGVVSTSAVFCPHCGYPMEERENTDECLNEEIIIEDIDVKTCNIEWVKKWHVKKHDNFIVTAVVALIATISSCILIYFHTALGLMALAICSICSMVALLWAYSPKIILKKVKDDVLLFYIGAISNYLIINDAIVCVTYGNNLHFTGELSNNKKVVANQDAENILKVTIE